MKQNETALLLSQTNIWGLLALAEDTADILGWVLFLLFSSHPLLNSHHHPPPPSPHLNILHLLNYLAAALWLGPELQWRLYLQIRAGLVTGAGHISLSRHCLRARDAFGHITQEEMSLPHCRLVISSLWSPRGNEGACVCVCMCVKVCNPVVQHKCMRLTRWRGDSLLGFCIPVSKVVWQIP